MYPGKIKSTASCKSLGLIGLRHFAQMNILLYSLRKKYSFDFARSMEDNQQKTEM